MQIIVKKKIKCAEKIISQMFPRRKAFHIVDWFGAVGERSTHSLCLWWVGEKEKGEVPLHLAPHPPHAKELWDISEKWLLRLLP